MKKEITKLIPLAIEATRKYLLADGQSRELVQKEYDGYAASLGAALRTSGLIPTLVFYTDVDRQAGGARRYKMLWAIAYCLGEITASEPEPAPRFLLERVIKDVYGRNVFERPVNDARLQRLPRPDQQRIKAWAKRISEASIALKLAMRNFEHTKS